MRPDMKRRLETLVNFKGTPHQLAASFGLGVVLGTLPGTGPIAAAVTAGVLRLNLPLMVGGALLTNPLTLPFVYGWSFLIGRTLLGDWTPTGFLIRILRVLLGTLVGNLVLAVGLGVAGYLVVLSVVAVTRFYLHFQRA